MYDLFVITHLPAFYKVNLYNELAKKLNLYVIFISENSIQRTSDFINLQCNFTYEILNKEPLEIRNRYKSIKKLTTMLKNKRIKNLLLSGWDLIEFWYSIFFVKAEIRSLAIESTLYESSLTGMKGFIKKLFLSRINRIYASGALSYSIAERLGFRDEIKITKGVGIIHKPDFTSQKKDYEGKFLYLGRLSPEKNLSMLIDIFNALPHLKLSIYGNGAERDVLENKAKQNITFREHIDNKKLKDVFAEHNFLILPSLREPWGLVVEEALYFGVPVIVSNRCGASVLVENNVNGLIVDPLDIEGFKRILQSIDESKYKYMKAHTGCDIINKKDEMQIATYLK